MLAYIAKTSKKIAYLLNNEYKLFNNYILVYNETFIKFD